MTSLLTTRVCAFGTQNLDRSRLLKYLLGSDLDMPVMGVEGKGDRSSVWKEKAIGHPATSFKPRNQISQAQHLTLSAIIINLAIQRVCLLARLPTTHRLLHCENRYTRTDTKEFFPPAH